MSNAVSEIPHKQLQLVRQCEDAFMEEDSHVVMPLLPQLHRHNNIVCRYGSPQVYILTYLVHNAAQRGWTDVTKELISIYNCDPTQKDSGGFTAVHWAAQHGHLNTLKYLVGKCGCSVSDRDDYGRTPLHTTVVNGNLAIVQYLVQY